MSYLSTSKSGAFAVGLDKRKSLLRSPQCHTQQTFSC